MKIVLPEADLNHGKELELVGIGAYKQVRVVIGKGNSIDVKLSSLMTALKAIEEEMKSQGG